MNRLKLSKSALNDLQCPYKYYLARIIHAPARTNYAMLLGAAVHQFIAQLYRRHLGERPFFYKDITAAQKAWFAAWKRAIDKSKKPLQSPNSIDASNFGGTGWLCIKTYWEQNVVKPPPLYIERSVKFPIRTGVDFVGVFDQIRRVSLDTIVKFRPDLIRNDNLSPGYAPIVIVDYKTNREGYDLGIFKPGASDKDRAIYQHSLHEDIQVTAYFWLYYMWTKNLPVGFFWYHLRSGKYYFTYRTQQDFRMFFKQVDFAIDTINAGNFPKVPGSNCRFCEVVEACAASRQPSRQLGFSLPVEQISDTGRQFTISTDVVAVTSKQRRFPSSKFKVQRIKKPKKEIVTKRKGKFILDQEDE